MDKITIYPSNWLYNAGVVGFLRILNFGGKRNLFEFNDDGSVAIDERAFDNFEIYYFEYVSVLYLMQRFSLKELVNFIKNLKNKCNEAEKNEIVEIESKIKKIENDIQQQILSVTGIESWDGFKERLEDIQESCMKKITEIEEDLKNKIKIIRDKEKNISEINEGIKKSFDSIFELKSQADFLSSFYFNKGVVANPKGSRKERISDFKEKYIDPIKRAKSGDILCIFCGNRYSREFISEFTEGDFSTLGISSANFANFYNYYVSDSISYNRKCSLCQLIILCAFAGFNLKPFLLRELDETDYIFVNYPSFKEAFDINNNIQEEFKNYQFGIINEKINVYTKSLELILTSAGKKTKWILENTYFAEIKTSVRKDQIKPKFVYFNIDKAFAEVFSEANANKVNINRLIRNLSFSYEVYKNNKVYLSTEVLKRLLEKKPLIYIAFKMFSEKIRDKDSNVLPMWSIILLEFLINQKRRHDMDAKRSYGILKSIQEEGRNSFSIKDIDVDKRFHISQRFLTLIRGARKEDFFNELLRLFIVYKKPVPETLFSLLTESDEVSFQEKALAFLTGFIDYGNIENSNINEKEVDNE